MARKVSEIQQHEIEAYAKFAHEHNIIHDGSTDDQANADLLLNYFLNTWNEMITPQTLAQAFPQLKPHLKFKSAARLEAEKAARENPTAAQPLARWLENQKMLVRDGDNGFLNFTLLINELRGREIVPDKIHQAMGRLNCRVGRQLVYVSRPKKEVDPNYRAGQFIEDYNKTPVDYSHEQQAAFEEKRESQATISKREQASAKSEAESMRSGYSAAEDDQVSRLFITDEKTRVIDWIATRNARQNRCDGSSCEERASGRTFEVCGRYKHKVSRNQTEPHSVDSKRHPNRNRSDK